MQFCAPINGAEGHFEIWVRTAIYRNGERVYKDCPDESDVSVGIRVILKEELLKQLVEADKHFQTIVPDLEAYLNTLDASIAGIGIPEEHLTSHEKHHSYADRFYWHVLLGPNKLQLKIIDIEQFQAGGNDEGRGVMHHLKLSGAL